MIKRSLVATLVALTSGVSARHVHSQKHYTEPHYAAYSAEVEAREAADAAALEVKETNYNVSNANICSFYTDYSLYVLKPVINYASSYSVDFNGETIDFNICDQLINPDSACAGAFACLKDSQGNYHPLSGSDFGNDIKGFVEKGDDGQDVRPGDTEKGGLTLYYEGST